MSAFILKYGRWLEAGLVLALLIAVFCFGWNYAHKDTIVAETRLSAATDRIQSQQKLLDLLAENTKKAQAEEAAAKLREQKMGAALDAFAKALPKKGEDFSKHTADIAKKPECAVLTEHLCPAAMGY
jgi:hypothetical protein